MANIEGKKVHSLWGRKGHNPSQLTKTFKTEALAMSYFNSKMKEKLHKGYKRVE